MQPDLSTTFPLLALSPESRWPGPEPARLAAQYLLARLTGDDQSAQACYDVTGDAELAEGMTRVAAVLALHLARGSDRPVRDVLAELVGAALRGTRPHPPRIGSE